MTLDELAIPEPILDHISEMKYTEMEIFDYYLSKDLDLGDHISTLVLARIPMGQSMGFTVDENNDLLPMLEEYLSKDRENSAVLLHFHPLRGPSEQDISIINERYNATKGRLKYAIIVGPECPTYWETDGINVSPINSLKKIQYDENIESLQNEVLKSFQFD